MDKDEWLKFIVLGGRCISGGGCGNGSAGPRQQNPERLPRSK